MTATPAQVRAFYNDETKGAARVAALPEGTSLKSLAPGARGRLAPALIAGYNKGKPVSRRYVSGNGNAVKAEAKAAAGALRAKAVEAGVVKAGSRGPLPKAFLVSEGIVKG